MSRPYAEVIGDPVAHSKSPVIHGFWLEKLGIEADYRRYHLRAEELEAYFAERREDPCWRGCNVTIPHKERVTGLVDEVEPRARKIGAVNTIWREVGMLRGGNSDVEGVAEAIRGVGLADRDVVVIGAGGAARSAFAHLEGRACRSVRVVARSPDRAKDVVSQFALPWSVHGFAETTVLEGAALIVNATQLGMAGQPEMPGSILAAVDSMASDGMVFDMVYSPLETPLLAAAARCERFPVDGLVMLIGQARTAFARFFGQPAPREHDAELRRILTS